MRDCAHFQWIRGEASEASQKIENNVSLVVARIYFSSSSRLGSFRFASFRFVSFRFARSPPQSHQVIVVLKIIQDVTIYLAVWLTVTEHAATDTNKRVEKCRHQKGNVNHLLQPLPRGLSIQYVQFNMGLDLNQATSA
tara:strand:+ start:148 stop:561 length:414 start_codon:yes stop_codon:yes gene_type:complete